jgi:hypothetical protein
MPFAFYGRMSTTGYQDPASSRRWQYDNATPLAAGYGVIVPEFFDPGFSPVNSRSVNYPRQLSTRSRPPTKRALAKSHRRKVRHRLEFPSAADTETPTTSIPGTNESGGVNVSEAGVGP